MQSQPGLFRSARSAAKREKSIDTNARSARAEPDSNAAVHPMDYLVYAHLQLGQDAAARRVVERAVQNPDRFYGGLLGYNFLGDALRDILDPRLRGSK